MSFQFLDHTADVAVDVAADSLAGLYAEAARAFTDTLTPLAGVQPGRTLEVRLDLPPGADLASDPHARENLMVEWLEELLYRFEVDGFLAARAEVELSAGALHATLHGETYAPDRHPVKVLVKAVTYHALEVRPTADAWTARVIFDI